MNNNTKIALAALAIAILGFVAFRALKGDESEDKSSKASVSEQGERPAPVRAGSSESSGSKATELPAYRDDDPVGNLRLEGQVVDEDDNPVAGAVVVLDSAPAKNTTSEDDGSFAFDNLVARRYSVFARSTDRVGGPVRVRLSSMSDPVLVRMQSGGGLEIEVVDHEGAPITGATVSLPSLESAIATTDSTGIAILLNLPPGQNFVAATAPGFARGSTLVTVPRAAETLGRQRVMLMRGVEVSGTIVDHQGRPVADAKVIARSVGALFSLQDPRRDGVSSDPEGHFVLPAVPSGSVSLVAVHEDHAPSSSERFSVGDTAVENVTLQMRAGASVSGQVSGTDGSAVSWATIRVVSSSRGDTGGGLSRQMIADESGGFTLRGLPREQLLIHASNERASSEGLEVDLRSKASAEGLAIQLTVEGSIAGTVVDEHGEPVPEAQVRAIPDFWEGAKLDQLRVRGPAFATTAGDGSFVIRGLPQTKFKIGATLGTQGGGTGRNANVSATTGDDNVRVVLATPATIVGKVSASDGSTPRLATVSIGWGASAPIADGRFRLNDVPPGKYELTVRGPSFADTFVSDVEVKAGEKHDVGTIQVEKGRTISGRVLTASGQPVAGAEVVLAQQLISDGQSLTPKNMGDAMNQMRGLRSTTSNQEGEYLLRGMGKSEWTVAADHAATGRSLGQTIPAGAQDIQLDISLRGVGRIRGKISVNGEARANVQVLVTSTEGAAHIVVVSSDERGSFFVERVAAGEMKVSAMMSAAGAGSMAATTVTVEPNQEVDASLDIEEGAVTLAVTITGLEGAKIDAAQVFLFRGAANVTTGGALNKLFLSAASGAKMGFAFGDGKTSFEKVSPGHYSVCVIPINGDMNDPAFAQKLQRHVGEIAVYCKQMDVADSPKDQDYQAQVPPMTPLPDD